jgi:hypothetical protein
VRLSVDADLLQTGFQLTREQHDILADGIELKLTNSSGDEAVVDMLTNIDNATPDPETIYRHAHPFALSFHPEHPDDLFLVDSGQNTILRINATTGRTRVMTRFARIDNPAPGNGPPQLDSVPDSIRPYGSEFLVPMLTGVPFHPGLSRVMAVGAATGSATVFIGAPSAAIDILYRATPAGPVFYVLEFSADQSRQGVPGRLLRIDTSGREVLVDGLTTPTSLAWDERAGEIYINELIPGRILRTQLR